MTDRGRTDEHAPWPTPGNTRFRFRVIDDDGELARRFYPAGGVELTILASEQPADAPGKTGYQYVVMPLSFPNYPIAREHGRAIDVACKLVETAIADALTHAADAIPSKDDGHAHVIVFERFSRALPFVATCEICMQEIVADVAAWAADRGIIPAGARHFGDVGPGTVKTAIELAVNRG